MPWQETNKEASKCDFEKLVSKVLWTISNPNFRLPRASVASWLTWPTGQAQPQKGSPLSCSWSLLYEGCHTCSTAPICTQTDTVHFSSWFLNLALFVPVFHLDFWLVHVRQAILTLRLRGENIACKRADDVWYEFLRGPQRTCTRTESISQVPQFLSSSSMTPTPAFFGPHP